MLLPHVPKNSTKEIQFGLETTERVTPLTYKVKISETLIWKVHVDQLRARVEEDDYFT